jgi:CTP:molybdopterin cytidylyltransferase MocA
VILAAGASARLGEPKALALVGGRTVLERLLEAGGASARDPALVIAGPHATEIASALAGRPAEVLRHPDWAAGRTGSLQAALARRAERDVCLAPCDVPLVPRAVFEALPAAWGEAGSPAQGWLGPAVRVAGRLRFGHPVVIGRDLLREVLSFPPDRPLRDLRRAARPLLALEVDERAILDDLDEPGDLERLERQTGASGPASPPEARDSPPGNGPKPL